MNCRSDNRKNMSREVEVTFTLKSCNDCRHTLLMYYGTPDKIARKHVCIHPKQCSMRKLRQDRMIPVRCPLREGAKY
jgi:hypothetical protein